MAKQRDPLDRYFTPPWCTRVLMDFLIDEEFDRIYGPQTVLEPCCGMRDIADVLEDEYDLDTVTFDIDPNSKADKICDFITHPINKIDWVDWVITNPPYSTDTYHAVDFIERSLKIGTSTGVAHLLRMSILEPCDNRAGLLQNCGPSYILYLPRPRFKWGATDSVTSVWLVWVRDEETDQWLPMRENGTRYYGNSVRERPPKDWVMRYVEVGDDTIHLDEEHESENIIDTIMRGAAE